MSGTAGGAGRSLVLAGVLLVAFNLRPALTAVGPILHVIETGTTQFREKVTEDARAYAGHMEEIGWLIQNQGGVIGTQTTDIGWRNHGTAVAGEIGRSGGSASTAVVDVSDRTAVAEAADGAAAGGRAARPRPRNSRAPTPPTP